MNSMDIFPVFAFAVLFFVGYLVLRWFKPKKDPLGINGKLIWVDRGRKTKPFFNKEFRVLGKPDLMYKLASSGVLAVEYKSRKGRIYESDVVQAKTAALAARGDGYRVSQILVKTKGTQQYFNLPASDSALFQEIQQYVAYTRAAKQGINLKALPQRYKCKTCAYSQGCESRA
tara:strand:- start:6246 stop:6764 length:519 start_codon:yes stop_codon:yes gene_type:complete